MKTINFTADNEKQITFFTDHIVSIIEHESDPNKTYIHTDDCEYFILRENYYDIIAKLRPYINAS